MSTVAILGTGVVGVTLARGLSDAGHTVRIGSRSGKTVDGWGGEVGTFAQVLAGADLAVVAVKGTVAEELVRSVAPELAGIPVVDTTNPIADVAPVDGVLSYFTGPNESLLERLQSIAPQAHFVKAFNSVGANLMVKPQLDGGQRPSMFIAGNDDGAKSVVAALTRDLGWDVEDMGTAVSARAIEPLCILWCIPGIRDGSREHAFKLLHTAG